MLRLVLALYATTALLFGIQHRLPAPVASGGDVLALLAQGALLPSGCGETPEDPGKAPAAHEPCAACLLVQAGAPPPARFGLARLIPPRALPTLTGLLATPPPAAPAARPPVRAPPVLV
jgi:hypothetical protein